MSWRVDDIQYSSPSMTVPVLSGFFSFHSLYQRANVSYFPFRTAHFIVILQQKYWLLHVYKVHVCKKTIALPCDQGFSIISIAAMRKTSFEVLLELKYYFIMNFLLTR